MTPNFVAMSYFSCWPATALPAYCRRLVCIAPSMQAMLQVTSMLLQIVIGLYSRYGDGPLSESLLTN